MDDTAQNTQNNDQNTTTQPVVTQNISSVSAPNKEAGPVSSNIESTYIEPSGAENMPDVPSELVEQGVEKSKDYERPILTEEHKNIGIQHAKESTPVITVPTGSVQVSMSEEEAEHIVKTDKKTNDGILWIATIILKHAKTLHKKVFS